MKQLQEIAEQIHRYQWASATEKKEILDCLSQDRSRNLPAYKQRFVEGANPKRPEYLRYSPSDFHKDNPPTAKTVFHEGLLRDEAWAYWIVKQFNPQARENREPREPRNSPRYERLAYLLARGRANYAEVRLLNSAENIQIDGTHDPRNTYYLTRVVIAKNTPVSSLPQKSAAEAFAAIFVANIFMRKWDQHLNNFAYSGDVPVSIDHDVIGPPVTFPPTPAGFSLFNLAFLSFKLTSFLSSLQPEQEVDQRAKERLKHHFVRQNEKEAWWIMRDLIHGLGLGAGLIRAEDLQVAALRRGIQSFKDLGSIHELAEQAGFRGRELENITRYLAQNLKTLGRDVGQIWRCLTGQDARLDQLD